MGVAFRSGSRWGRGALSVVATRTRGGRPLIVRGPRPPRGLWCCGLKAGREQRERRELPGAARRWELCAHDTGSRPLRRGRAEPGGNPSTVSNRSRRRFGADHPRGGPLSLPMILAVGFSVRSARGTPLRRWAWERLNEHLTKGVALFDAQVARPADSRPRQPKDGRRHPRPLGISPLRDLHHAARRHCTPSQAPRPGPEARAGSVHGEVIWHGGSDQWRGWR
ncbi:MAG: virulence RhuM family protein [Deltaproteobacteria bacterium]|nr:virulence RhuM family protein [Deltaproteobacteria bacterium]